MIIAGYRDSTIAVYDVVADEFGLSEGSRIVSREMFFKILTANITAGKATEHLNRVIEAAPKKKESKVDVFISPALYVAASIGFYFAGMSVASGIITRNPGLISVFWIIFGCSASLLTLATYLMVAK